MYPLNNLGRFQALAIKYTVDEPIPVLVAVWLGILVPFQLQGDGALVVVRAWAKLACPHIDHTVGHRQVVVYGVELLFKLAVKDTVIVEHPLAPSRYGAHVFARTQLGQVFLHTTLRLLLLFFVACFKVKAEQGGCIVYCFFVLFQHLGILFVGQKGEHRLLTAPNPEVGLLVKAVEQTLLLVYTFEVLAEVFDDELTVALVRITLPAVVEFLYELTFASDGHLFEYG